MTYGKECLKSVSTYKEYARVSHTKKSVESLATQSGGKSPKQQKRRPKNATKNHHHVEPKEWRNHLVEKKFHH